MKRHMQTFMLFLLSFLLLWEWLRPLTELVEMKEVIPFVLFSGFTFFLTLYYVPIYVAFPVKCIGMMTVIYYYFYTQYSFFSFEWWGLWFQIVIKNFQWMFTNQFYLIDPIFKTTLLLILLWLITYLLNYWVVKMKKSVVFIILTYVFLGLMSTFTTYDASFAIVRTTVVAMLLLSLLQIIRLKEAVHLRWDAKKVFGPVFIFIGLSLLFAFVLPTHEPKWKDPLAFLNDDSQNKKGKSGIDENDENLGGPFEYNHDEVFKLKTQYPMYLRVEHKTTYTGKGWEKEPEEWQELSNSPASLGLYDRSEVNKIPVEIFDIKKTKKRWIPYPGEITNIVTKQNVSIKRNMSVGRLEWVQNKNDENVSKYAFDYYLPGYSEEELRSIRVTKESEYTDLPTTVPNRVKNLAISLTENEKTNYDKAKAIERYFQSDEFTYETEDVAVPAKNEDYVDQFLFETKKGYCDNYSTSMVVLLRSVGIEARWVKGYRQGEVIHQEEQIYQVTNAFAHSWVEVYFDGFGWVPFEPTKGMVNPLQIPKEKKEIGEGIEQQEEMVQEEEQEVEQQEEEKIEKQEINKKMTHSKHLFAWIVIMLVILFIFMMIWKRKTIVRQLFFSKVFSFDSKKQFIRAYQRLIFSLKWLKRMKKESHETDREFAIRVENELNIDELLPLTETYEKIKYGKESHDSWERERELYENLVNKILS